MQRTWQIHPDQPGQMSREALIGALIDGAALLDIAGGVLSVMVGRAPTDLPGEMVMTTAILEWRDRTDAKAQPERPSTVPTTTAETDEFLPASESIAAEAEADANDANPDGFDYSRLAEEDVEEPELAR